MVLHHIAGRDYRDCPNLEVKLASDKWVDGEEVLKLGIMDEDMLQPDITKFWKMIQCLSLGMQLPWEKSWGVIDKTRFACLALLKPLPLVQ